MDRQLGEAIMIARNGGMESESILNSKDEFSRCLIPEIQMKEKYMKKKTENKRGRDEIETTGDDTNIQRDRKRQKTSEGNATETPQKTPQDTNVTTSPRKGVETRSPQETQAHSMMETQSNKGNTITGPQEEIITTSPQETLTDSRNVTKSPQETNVTTRPQMENATTSPQETHAVNNEGTQATKLKDTASPQETQSIGRNTTANTQETNVTTSPQKGYVTTSPQEAADTQETQMNTKDETQSTVGKGNTSADPQETDVTTSPQEGCEGYDTTSPQETKETPTNNGDKTHASKGSAAKSPQERNVTTSPQVETPYGHLSPTRPTTNQEVKRNAHSKLLRKEKGNNKVRKETPTERKEKINQEDEKRKKENRKQETPTNEEVKTNRKRKRISYIYDSDRKLGEISNNSETNNPSTKLSVSNRSIDHKLSKLQSKPSFKSSKKANRQPVQTNTIKNYFRKNQVTGLTRGVVVSESESLKVGLLDDLPEKVLTAQQMNRPRQRTPEPDRRVSTRIKS